MSDTRLPRRLTLAWAAVILVFAVVPTHALLSSTVGERETLTTQIGHFAEFAVLAALGLWWAGERSRREGGAARDGDLAADGAGGDGPAAGGMSVWTARGVWAAAFAYGAAIEVLQAPLSYRSAEVGDLMVDAAGALTGLLVFSGARVLLARRGRRRDR